MSKSLLDLPTPALWICGFLLVNGALAVLNTVTWSLLWLFGFESVWTLTVMLTASLLFIEYHLVRKVVKELVFARQFLRRISKTMSKIVDAGKEDP